MQLNEPKSTVKPQKENKADLTLAPEQIETVLAHAKPLSIPLEKQDLACAEYLSIALNDYMKAP